MAQNNEEVLIDQVLSEINGFIMETKFLAEKVLQFRMACRESQINMLKLFDPEILRIIDEYEVENKFRNEEVTNMEE